MTAPREYRAMFGEVKTSLPGITFGAQFPRLAKLAHKMAVIRSYRHGIGSHGPAALHVAAGGNADRGRRRGRGEAGGGATTAPGRRLVPGLLHGLLGGVVLCQHSLAVGDRDLVIVGVNFAKGKKTVAIATKFDECRL